LSPFLNLQRERQGVLLCLLAAAGFGAMAIFAKVAYDAGFDARTLLLLRFVVAAALLWPIVALRRPAVPPLRIVLVAVALGAVGYAVQAGAFFASLERIDASLASLVLYAYPALVLLGAIALGRERPNAVRAMALGLASAGIVLVLAGGGAGALDATGVAFALTAAIAYASYILVADRAVAGVDPFLLTAIIVTGAGVTTAGWNVAAGIPDLHVGASGWAALAGVAIVSTVLPATAFLLGLRRVGAGTASIVSTIEPVITVGLAMVVFGEHLTPLQAVGGLGVIAAVVIVNTRRAPRPAPVTLDSRRGPAAVPAAGAPARTLTEHAAGG
jgi:drug/metabolite transporter (DMT)-like permease